MNVPVATYRVQLNSKFDFNDLRQVLPYFKQLGISHIYASPIFQAKKGSVHGYDIVNPNQISEQLGGREAFESLMNDAVSHGLCWMQDIVPNHQSYSIENKNIYDILQNGPASKYFDYFDVDWNYPSKKLRKKILAPFLNEPYTQSLKNKRVTVINQQGSKLKYNNLIFPLNTTEDIERVNSDPSFLNGVLSNQFYSLAYWKVALKKINYRRFFDIIDLIGIKVENPFVLEATHRLIFKLANTNKFWALRVDHIDGLYDPQVYLQEMRKKLPDSYILVEKILSFNEQLPVSWPIQGSTGYDFLNFLNSIFIDTDNERQIDDLYKRFSGNDLSFVDLLYVCKKIIIETYFLGDIKNLARLFNDSLMHIESKKISIQAMRQAIIELLASFPVYRSYVSDRELNFDNFKQALDQARKRNETLVVQLESINSLLGKIQDSSEALHAIMRLQQFSGAITAKGLEDTAFYRYSKFISANEVGGNPAKLGLPKEEFHNFILARQQNWRFSLNTTSTHDTKRGEDVRARLNVISELPEEFTKALYYWSQINSSSKQPMSGIPAPNRNEEYYIYQTLLGAYPWVENEKPEFINRAKEHMTKALREAKYNSNWLSPNIEYEAAVDRFIERILECPEFLETFLPLQKKIAFFGFFNALSQTVLKMTCPGVPDFYQGTELWDLHMVDPDNRRQVDYKIRQQALTDIATIQPSKSPLLLEEPYKGNAKLYLISKILQLRNESKALFDEGTYIPLTATGKHNKSIISFMRERNGSFIIVVVSRFLSKLLKPHGSWATCNWADTAISLPDVRSDFTDVITGKRYCVGNNIASVREILGTFPVAVLFGEGSV